MYRKLEMLSLLKYDSIDWIDQSLATRVENVNPFHVIEYNGEFVFLHLMILG